MAFDSRTMKAVLTHLQGQQVAGFKERQTGVFHEMMKIDSGIDLDLFMETYNVAVVCIE